MVVRDCAAGRAALAAGALTAAPGRAERGASGGRDPGRGGGPVEEDAAAGAAKAPGPRCSTGLRCGCARAPAGGLRRSGATEAGRSRTADGMRTRALEPGRSKPGSGGRAVAGGGAECRGGAVRLPLAAGRGALRSGLGGRGGFTAVAAGSEGLCCWLLLRLFLLLLLLVLERRDWALGWCGAGARRCALAGVLEGASRGGKGTPAWRTTAGRSRGGKGLAKRWAAGSKRSRGGSGAPGRASAPLRLACCCPAAWRRSARWCACCWRAAASARRACTKCGKRGRLMALGPVRWLCAVSRQR